MTKRTTIATLLLLVGASLTSYGATATAKTLIDPSGPLYQGQRFSLTIEITAEGVSLDSRIELGNLPDTADLKLGRFIERPVKRTRSGMSVTEKRTFTADAYALRAGTLAVAPTINARAIRREGFAQLINNISLRAPLQTVEILPLPSANVPDGFTGAVGAFAVSANLNATNAWVNDLLTAVITVSGSGTLPDSPLPRVQHARHFRVYPPELIAYVPGQTLKISQILHPLSTNATAIPPVSFPYFNPQTARYQVATASFPTLVFEQGKRTVAGGGLAAGLLTPDRGAHSDDRTSIIPVGRPAIIALIVLPVAGLLILSCALLFRRVRPMLPALLSFVIAGLLIALGFAIRDYHKLTSRVFLSTAKEAFFAPSNESRILFTLPPHRYVDVVERHNEWIRIRHGDNGGWITTNNVVDMRKVTD